MPESAHTSYSLIPFIVAWCSRIWPRHECKCGVEPRHPGIELQCPVKCCLHAQRTQVESKLCASAAQRKRHRSSIAKQGTRDMLMTKRNINTKLRQTKTTNKASTLTPSYSTHRVQNASRGVRKCLEPIVINEKTDQYKRVTPDFTLDEHASACMHNSRHAKYILQALRLRFKGDGGTRQTYDRGHLSHRHRHCMNDGFAGGRVRMMLKYHSCWWGDRAGAGEIDSMKRMTSSRSGRGGGWVAAQVLALFRAEACVRSLARFDQVCCHCSSVAGCTHP